MSTFMCTECGATFEGDLQEAADKAFEHTAEHAEAEQTAAAVEQTGEQVQ